MMCWDQLHYNSEERDEDELSDDEMVSAVDELETVHHDAWGPWNEPAPTCLYPVENVTPPPIPATRTLYHPTFEAYYAAVLQGAKTPEMQSRTGEGFSINNGEYFYIDPLLSAGRRVYNCLSPATQNVFGCLRLETPPPIMSPCIFTPTAHPQAPIPQFCIIQEVTEETPGLNTATGLPGDLLYDGRNYVTPPDLISAACEIAGIIPFQSVCSPESVTAMSPPQLVETAGNVAWVGPPQSVCSPGNVAGVGAPQTQCTPGTVTGISPPQPVCIPGTGISPPQSVCIPGTVTGISPPQSVCIPGTGISPPQSVCIPGTVTGIIPPQSLCIPRTATSPPQSSCTSGKVAGMDLPHSGCIGYSRSVYTISELEAMCGLLYLSGKYRLH